MSEERAAEAIYDKGEEPACEECGASPCMCKDVSDEYAEWKPAINMGGNAEEELAQVPDGESMLTLLIDSLVKKRDYNGLTVGDEMLVGVLITARDTIRFYKGALDSLAIDVIHRLGADEDGGDNEE
jgi:hypothetical protein